MTNKLSPTHPNRQSLHDDGTIQAHSAGVLVRHRCVRKWRGNRLGEPYRWQQAQALPYCFAGRNVFRLPVHFAQRTKPGTGYCVKGSKPRHLLHPLQAR